MQTAADLLLGKLTRDKPAVLARVALGPDGKGRYEPTTTVAEFPKSDPRFAGKARSLSFHTWGKPGREDRTSSPQGIGSSNHRTGRVDHFDFGLRHLVEEPLFAPRPGSSAEGDGWLLATSLNLDAGVTELHAFDARRIAAGPLATWRSDVALPLTFHGAYVRTRA
jgi:carotenoid cleavage dioxygenase-like enzyme